MSQLFALPSLELLLIAGRAVALVLGLLIFAWAFRHWRRAASRDTQRVFEQLDLVRSELLIMKEVMHHSAHRTDSVPANRSTKHYDLPAATHSTPRLLATTNASGRGYEIAARMARNGAGKDELIRSCGITGHEAELLVKLHGQRHGGGADLIGRQPRVAESTTGSSAPTARNAQATNPLLQPNRPATTTPRQNTTAATATQRTERAAPTKSQGLPPRSRLVAVG